MANREYNGQFSVEDLRNWNPGIDDNDLKIGQKINLVPLEDVKKDDLVRWIAENIDSYGVDPKDPAVLNIISSSIDFDKLVWEEMSVYSGNPFEGIGIIGQVTQPVFEKALYQLISEKLAKKGVSKVIMAPASQIITKTAGTAFAVVFMILDPSSIGPQSFTYEDRSIRAQKALKNYVKNGQN